MTEQTDLAQIKQVYIDAKMKLRRMEKPLELIQQLTEVVKNAAATDRMGTDAEFAKFMNEDMAGLTSDMATTTSFDEVVSLA